MKASFYLCTICYKSALSNLMIILGLEEFVESNLFSLLTGFLEVLALLTSILYSASAISISLFEPLKRLISVCYFYRYYKFLPFIYYSYFLKINSLYVSQNRLLSNLRQNLKN